MARINPMDGKPLLIASISDERKSLFGNKLSPEEQAINVGGAFRGGSGFAVNLEDETAVSEMRKILTQALRGMGYRVLPAGAEQSPDTTVAVAIEKFEVTMPFNFWRAATYSQHMVADIQTRIVVSDASGAKTIKISGQGRNIYQIVTPENWQITLNRAVSEYTKRLQAAMLELE